MKKKKIIVSLVVLALCCVFPQIAFADTTGNGGDTPTINADNPQGVWQHIQELMQGMESLSNQELIGLIEQGGQDALFARKELISRGADAVPDILEALQDPDTQRADLLAGALVKIVKNNPELAKDVLSELGEIANNSDYTDAQRLAAAQAMVAIGGKAAFAALDKDIKLQLVQAMLEKANDIHSSQYWINNGNDPFPNH